MNQALRHLWTRAYQNPYPSLETGKAEEHLGSYSPVVTPVNGRPVVQIPVLAKAPRVSKPRILIAKPKSLNRNDKIRQGLEHAYPGQWKGILDQAFAAYYYTNPRTSNLPELYELNESGYLDMGIEACGLHQWAIGRPK